MTGQVVTADLLGRDLLVCPFGDGEELPQALGPGVMACRPLVARSYSRHTIRSSASPVYRKSSRISNGGPASGATLLEVATSYLVAELARGGVDDRALAVRRPGPAGGPPTRTARSSPPRAPGSRPRPA